MCVSKTDLPVTAKAKSIAVESAEPLEDSLSQSEGHAPFRLEKCDSIRRIEDTSNP
jgi:hypothetical protein